MYKKILHNTIGEKIKKVNKVLDLYAVKFINFYRKIYKNKHESEFFYVQKFYIHVYISLYIMINLSLFPIYLSISDFIIGNILFSIFLMILSLILFIIFFNDKKKLYKLSDEEWEHYKDKYCYHLTSIKNIKSIKVDDENIFLKPTIYWMANIQNWFRPSVYFFSSVPNEEQIKGQLLTNKKDVMIKIPIANLDRDRLKIRRKVYNVMVYTGPYVGEGEIIKFE